MQLQPNILLQGGKYRIKKVLGQGGFGITYLGIQESLNRKVAIKEFFMKEYCGRNEVTSQITLGTEGSHELVERFRQKFIKEAQIIAGLNNAHIISIYDIFEENGTAYYVMEYVGCGSLKDKIENYGAIHDSEALLYIRQIADALKYLHDRKIMHLDIKPSNILLRDTNEVVLIDFGISKRYDGTGEQTSSTPIGISKGFAPLEQYKQGGVKTFSPATDIYSLGGTLFYLLTGNQPPEASDVINNGLSLPKNISPNIRKVIRKAMEAKHSDRPQAISEFLAILDDKKKHYDESNEETTVLNEEIKEEKQNNKQPVTQHTIKKEIKQKTKNKKIYHIGLSCIVAILIIFGIIKGLGNRNTQVALMYRKPTQDLTLSGLNPIDFQAEVNNAKTNLYTLKNKSGMEVCITNFGGRIVSVMVPDKNGNMQDVVLGFDNIADYVNIPNDFGASIGRYAGRINQGRFILDEKTIQLPQNNFGHCLDGGPKGWQYQVYEVSSIDETTLELTHFSQDGDEGFPGNVTAKVLFKLTDNNAIDIEYSATTDQKTIINMTNHSYFNLSGNPSKTITNHSLYINADNYTPIDDMFMTTGEIVSVRNTPMDFTTLKTIGKDITNFNFVQLKNGIGYDHNWVLNTKGDITQLVAKLISPESGITLEVFTNEPGIQVYTGNFLDGTIIGKKDITYNQYASVCLETQHYPDSPNKPKWPSVILKPGQFYNSKCIFKFSVEK